MPPGTEGQPNSESRQDRRSDREGGGFDINKVVMSMIGREKGNAKAVIRHLVREGRRYRTRLRTVEEDLATRPPKLKEGEIILNKEDATKWTALKDISLTPEQVKESLKKKDELETAERNRTQGELAARGSKELGIKRPQIVARELIERGMTAEEREVEEVVDGKKVKKAQVQVRPANDPKAAWRSLEDFVNKDLKDLQPALMADEDPEEESSGNRDSTKEETTVMFPVQRGARGRAPAKDAVVKVIGDKYASPSELRKKQST
jgi:hypothetical protein